MSATPPPWQTRMREEVRRAALEAGTTRHLPARCRVGHPGGETVLLADAHAEPLELRSALVERALDGLEALPGALAWVIRSGELGAGDDELAWWAAAQHGFACHGVRLEAFCVLNRHGWTDLVSGAGRSWSRMRA